MPQDYQKAEQWFEKAAAAGNVTAMANLGYLYAQGQGVPQNYEKAQQWYGKAAAAGNADAQQQLQALSGAQPTQKAESQ